MKQKPGKKRKPVKITKRVVDAARPKGREVRVMDSGVPGFMLRVHPGGKKTYALKYGLGMRGKTRWVPIGEHGQSWDPHPVTGRPRTLTPDLARARAAELRAQVGRGGNPAEERQATRKIPTLREFTGTKEKPGQYLKFAEKKKKLGSVRNDRANLETAILPVLGARRLDQIGPEDVERLHQGLKDTPVKANRCIALLSHVMNMACTWRVISRLHENPCRDVQDYPEMPRERRLSDDELARAGAAIDLAETEGKKSRRRHARTAGAPHASPSVIAALRTVIFTGARPGEIVGLRRDELDIERRLIVKKEWKTRGKTKVPVIRAIPLSDEAVLVLAEQLESRSDRSYVFPGRLRGTPVSVTGLDGVWDMIRKYAKLEDVRVSDLGRHNFASVGADSGYSMPAIAKLLGHTSLSTTQRYAHFGSTAARQAADAISKRIASALSKSVS